MQLKAGPWSRHTSEQVSGHKQCSKRRWGFGESVESDFLTARLSTAVTGTMEKAQHMQRMTFPAIDKRSCKVIKMGGGKEGA
jgi:hypothetical protein